MLNHEKQTMNEKTRRTFLTEAVTASAVLLGACNRSPSTGASGTGSDRTTPSGPADVTLRIGAVLLIQIDAAQLEILSPAHQDFFRCLNEEYRMDRVEQKTRNAMRPAARSSREPNFPRQHLIIDFSHLLDHPGLQDRVGKVRNFRCFLPSDGIGNIRVGGIGFDGARARSRREKFVAGWFQPAGDVIRSKIGKRRVPRGEHRA